MPIAKKKQSPLRAALDNERGRDYKLEKQRKAEKSAAKRKGLPPPLPKGAAKKLKKAALKAETDEDAIIEESDEEDVAEDNVELDSGSVSDDEGEDDDDDGELGGASLAEQIKKLAAAARQADPDRKKSGKSAAAPTDEDEDEDEDEDLEADSDLEEEDEDEEDEDEDEEETGGALLKSTKSKSRSNGIPLTTSTPDDDDDDDDEEEEEEEEDEDIPLSDLESLASGDSADIIPHQRLTINNTTALAASLARIRLPTDSMPFAEHMSITSPTPTKIDDVNDDLNRELSLYAQSLHAVQTARPLLAAEGAPFSRPTDYFAEMVKTDEHMAKIRGRLVEEAARKKASQDARRLRDAKKFGKAVQTEKLKERAAARRAMLDGVAGLKRKRGAEGVAGADEGLFDVALEDAAASAARDKAARRAGGGKGGKDGKDGGRNAKRVKKDEKFGFGGKKRHSKSNDAMSSGDVRGLSRAGGAKGKKGAGAAKRPGKARRAKGRA